ncbi:MAG: hypothetical protein H0W42_07175 [Gemmatimonadaceae bacterium]|nr:hypothetical protein [Gemmatimonadaceae bacterium]
MTDDFTDETRSRELDELTAALPREMTPPAEAWDVIGSQIQRDGQRGQARTARTARAAAVWQHPAFLAAASLLLVAGSSAATYTVLRERSQPTPPRTASAEPVSTAVSTVSNLSEFTGKENEYLRRVSGLITIMESGDAELAPETIAKVKESLAVIDGAILEARGALARDPANRQLIEMLEATYEKKLDLLQRTTAMARS